MQLTEIIITGASGFLGSQLQAIAQSHCPAARIVAIGSPKQGGIDLTDSNCFENLAKRVRLKNPESSLLIHTAAAVDWHSIDGLLKNAAMAHNIAAWAKANDIAFSILVSSVSVYPRSANTEVDSSVEPSNIYGLGKLSAEHLWRLLFAADRRAILRLAGIWGWQSRPTLFWNRLLFAAARGTQPSERLIVKRRLSRRNYISAREACECLVHIGVNRLPGLFLGAGRDPMDTGEFINAVQALPGSKLEVEWQDDGGHDEEIYEPSQELLSRLGSFDNELSLMWSSKPNWPGVL
ncbi:MAG TPA: NAD(P)-dependent oxidoreductase [Opitutaceae bacterium]|nr:NAD(P)-dependent oxidoreductase [Opitutaceae bacterium]